MGKLDGQIAIVTGAGTGIGRATALGIAAEGATTLLVGRRQRLLEECAAEIEQAGGKSEVHALDVADQQAVDTLVADTLTRHGQLDQLISAAGMNTTNRNLRDLTVEDWRRVVDVNMTGPYLLTRAALPSMRKRGQGTIIVVASVAALFPGPLSGVAYSASKAGVSAMVQSINAEERRFGIRACAIQVGEVDTPIMDFRPFPPPDEDRKLMLQSEDVAAAIVYVATQPMRTNVEEILMRPTIIRPSNDYEKVIAGWEKAGLQ